MKNRILLSLFGLPFFCVGLWMLWSAGAMVVDSLSMRGWTPVPATLEAAGYHVHGGDSTTWEACARYRYEFGGREYSGERVAVGSGADNIGSFQRNLGNRLAAALAHGETVTAWAFAGVWNAISIPLP